MKKNMLFTCAALSVAWCFLAAVASAAEFTWTGGGSGWADGANWGGTAPGAGDTASPAWRAGAYCASARSAP